WAVRGRGPTVSRSSAEKSTARRGLFPAGTSEAWVLSAGPRSCRASRSQLPLPDTLEQVLGGARARLCGAFDEALEVVEAVRVLAREREVPCRLAKPTLHRREVAWLIAGEAPERVRAGAPVGRQRGPPVDSGT